MERPCSFSQASRTFPARAPFAVYPYGCATLRVQRLLDIPGRCTSFSMTEHVLLIDFTETKAPGSVIVKLAESKDLIYKLFRVTGDFSVPN